MGKKKLTRELQTLYQTKREHEVKRRQADDEGDRNLVNYYDREIARIDRDISELESRLNSSEVECPYCGRLVVPINNKCPRCDGYPVDVD